MIVCKCFRCGHTASFADDDAEENQACPECGNWGTLIEQPQKEPDAERTQWNPPFFDP